MRLKKIKVKKIERMMNSWVGVLICIAIGLLLVYFSGFDGTFLYLLIILGVPLIYYFKKQDYLPYIIGGALMAIILNRTLGFALSTDLPVVFVMSPSMVHDETTETTHYQWLENKFGYNRSTIDSWPAPDGFLVGDIIIIEGTPEYKVGDVVVYTVSSQENPIIHRIIYINSDGTYMVKGDHNSGLFSWEYKMKKDQLHGKLKLIIPKLGLFNVLVSKTIGGLVALLR